MDKRILQTYAVWAKDNLEQQVEVSLKTLGINGDNDIRRAETNGEYTIIDGDTNSYPITLYMKRSNIVELVRRNGYKKVIEEVAYTWFNRLIALRFMELHDFFPHGFRVLSSTSGSVEPDLLKNIGLVKDDLHLDMKICAQFKAQNKTEELFRYVLICQCNALSDILPMLFSRDWGFMELLLPKALLIGETVLTKLLEIPEENFMNDVEIMGWFYQFYVSNKRQEYREAKIVTKELLPTLTQVFTTDWIVRYMVENSVGHIWMESYPQSPLRSSMQYYVDNPKQIETVQKEINEIKYKNVNPEKIRVIEPCSGSGHILVYVMDLLYKMYEEKGYNKRDIPTLILKNNLIGLDVDKRAAQLASFSLIMKARTLNNRFFRQEYYTLPHVYELQDSHMMKALNYRESMKELRVFSKEEINAVSELVETFEDGKIIGSLIKVPALDYNAIENVIEKLEHKVVPNTFNVNFLSESVVQLKVLLNQARILSDKYDVMVTNPPYLSSSKIESRAKEYLLKEYPYSKADMFAMFMEIELVKQNGFKAMVTPDSWMYIGSYEKFRNNITTSNNIICLHSMDFGTFDAMVQTATFVLRKNHIDSFITEFQSANEDKYYVPVSLFASIPSSSFSYWISPNILKVFEYALVDTYCVTREGMTTANNDRFLRLWHEVSFEKIAFTNTRKKWFPYLKGGDFRKWYGNHQYVVNWENDGIEIRNFKDEKTGRIRSHNYNGEWALKEGFSWSEFSSSDLSIRYCKGGFLFDTKGCMGFANGTVDVKYIMALYNSVVGKEYTKIFCATTDYKPGQIIHIPLILAEDRIDEIEKLVSINIAIAKDDWDSFETSWDFQHHPFLICTRERVDAGGTQSNKQCIEKHCDLAWNYIRWSNECQSRFNMLKENEEKLNRIFIDVYGLQDELKSEVNEKSITVWQADKERDVKAFISYLVGIVMGRYSLDVPGLVYAGGEWDTSKYQTYLPDDDGIVPIYRGIGMEDGLTAQIIGLLKLIYGENSYRQNIEFIAESIGRNNNESSEEALNRYLNDGFYADHVKIYQKRPIYWLFSSGKNGGFKCLIYIHRYNCDTIARINSRYFLSESTRLKNDLDELLGRLAKAEGRDRIRLEKERQKLAAAYNEAIEYGQVLDHIANQFIKIDLDDGVKYNYDRFQGIEMVTDSGKKVKKNLLAPMK